MTGGEGKVNGVEALLVRAENPKVMAYVLCGVVHDIARKLGEEQTDS